MKKIITISALLLTAFAPQAMAQEQTQPTQQTARPAFDNELLPWETPRDTTCHEVLLETTMGNIRVALYNDTPHHRDISSPPLRSTLSIQRRFSSSKEILCAR